MYVYCNRSQMMSECVKNIKVRHETKSSCVTCSLHAAMSSVIYYSTHRFIKWFWKQVCWRVFDAICVCPLIDHGQQSMQMHTEVTLLYNRFYVKKFAYYLYRSYKTRTVVQLFWYKFHISFILHQKNNFIFHQKMFEVGKKLLLISLNRF